MTITEVSQKYDLSADTLRYYERIGLIPPVKPKWQRNPRLYRRGLQLGKLHQMYEKSRVIH